MEITTSIFAWPTHFEGQLEVRIGLDIVYSVPTGRWNNRSTVELVLEQETKKMAEFFSAMGRGWVAGENKFFDMRNRSAA